MLAWWIHLESRKDHTHAQTSARKKRTKTWWKCWCGWKWEEKRLTWHPYQTRGRRAKYREGGIAVAVMMAFGNECDFLCGVDRSVGKVAVKQQLLWENLPGTELSGNRSLAPVCSSVAVVCVPQLVEILRTAFLEWLSLCVTCVLWRNTHSDPQALIVSHLTCRQNRDKSRQVPLPSSGFISQKIKNECNAALQTIEADFFFLSLFYFCCADVDGFSHLSARTNIIIIILDLLGLRCQIYQKKRVQSVWNDPCASHLYGAFAFVYCFEYLSVHPRNTDCC